MKRPDGPFKRLFEQGSIGDVSIKNRIVMAPIGNSFWGHNGEVTEKLIDLYAAVAKGGAGLITVSHVTIDFPPGYAALGSLYTRDDMAGHYALVEKLHAYGAKVSLQVMHRGRQASPKPGLRLISSSAIPSSWLGERPLPVPEPLTIGEIYTIIDHYVQIALNAKGAGYDMIEIHGAHGYLVHSFMSPYMNVRRDEFGGSLENRMRFPTQLIAELKASVGPGFPVGIRISGEDFVKGGITIEESPTMARMLQDAGASFIHASAGMHETAHKCSDMARLPEGWKSYIWAAIKRAVDIPVIGVGTNRTPEFCEQVLEQGQADFIALGRQLLADPDWPNKSAKGQTEDLRKCISCMECLGPMTGRAADTRCTVNVAVGRQKDFVPIGKAPVRKQVMVIGAGPGGMEAARIAALRGHDVTLCDRGAGVGGQLLIASKPPGKQKLLWLRDYEEVQLRKLNVKLRLGVEVTPDMVEAAHPDAVIVATGSRPKMWLPAFVRMDAASAWDVLEGKITIENQRVVIVGGGMVGAETAEFLVDKGNTVTIVEELTMIAQDMEPLNRKGLVEALHEKGVAMLTGHSVREASSRGVIVGPVQGNGADGEISVETESLVLAVGALPNSELIEALRACVPSLYTVGDCVKPRNIMAAVYEGAFAAMQI
jgi:2,4-dienoyl-CoA reductase-like NADH-dependent reductase (Old Yellow Enzyme family)/thioredoxin reductase